MMYDEHIATLIVTVLFGLIIAFFAIQNTAAITLNFLNYQIRDIPTYIALVGALLVGLFLSWIINTVNNVGTGFTMRGKESNIKDSRQENAELLKKNHQLELENARINSESEIAADDKSL
jgi:uncharacterized integral membrane protein